MLLTDFPEGSELLPAGDQGAGPAEPVALAGHLHAVDHCLQHGQQLIYGIYGIYGSLRRLWDCINNGD